MPSYVEPKKNTEFIMYASLRSQADANLFQVNPTMAAGDVKVSIDGGSEANITTLPVVTPAGSKRLKVTLSASEMNGDNIQITFGDAAGSEWCDMTVNIQTASYQVNEFGAVIVDALADSYAADGAQPTLPQAVLAIKQFLEERSVSGTTVTVRKPDGSTTAMEFTLNSATTPTSITRS